MTDTDTSIILQREICNIFCDGLVVREVPVGYVISAPVTWFSGDMISFYVRVDGDNARLEDSGGLLAELEGHGADFSADDDNTKILSDLLNDHSIVLEEGVFCTEWVPKNQVAELALPFLIFLANVQVLFSLDW